MQMLPARRLDTSRNGRSGLLLSFAIIVATSMQFTVDSFVVKPQVFPHSKNHYSQQDVDSSCVHTADPTVCRQTSTSSRLFLSQSSSDSKRTPSKVSDPDGPTPDFEDFMVNEIDPDALDELKDLQSPEELPEPPVAHQPWRRGDTAGCHEPISAQWRKDAEKIIYQSAMLVGATVLDVTWYLTQVVITIDDDKYQLPEQDILKSSGPVINIIPKASPMYYDPNDPNPEDIWESDTAEGEILYQHETPEEAEASRQRKNMMYATKDEEDPVDEPHIPDQEGDDDEDNSLFMNEETRADVALKVAEDELERYEEQEKPIDLDTIRINTAVISSIAEAILTALEEEEDELQILSRHEVILTSPGPPDVLETQKQFDAHAGHNIIVETQDPFDSNRTLKGQLVNRNSMDLILNQKGRMVTIPLNFVKCVRVVSPPRTESEASELTP